MADEIRIRLYRNNHLLANCKANHIGLFGIHVHADPLMFPKGSLLEVEIIVCKTGYSRNYKLAAVVTSRSVAGVGMTFANINDSVCFALQDIISHINPLPALLKHTF